MNERDLWWKIVIVGCVAALAYATAFPLKEKLKFGIDLYGGYSLIYEIDDSGMDVAEKADLSQRVMRVLRDRVDPDGVFNLVWRPIGSNRLEIQMPRPSDAVREARGEYDSAQQRIRDTLLRRSDIVRAVSRTGEDRTTAIDQLVRGIEKRRALLAAAAEAYDAHRADDAAYQARVKEIEANNLMDAEVRAAVEGAADQRSAAFEGLVRGIEDRRTLLDAAAKAWDEVNAARPTTQPADATSQPSADALREFAAKERAYSAAVAQVVATNVDPGRLTEGVTIDTVIEAEDRLNRAIADVLVTNIDTGALQSIVEAKPGEERTTRLKEFSEKNPELAGAFDQMTAAADALKQVRRGEGRLEDPADLQRLLRGAGVLEFRILAKPDAGDPEKYANYIESLKTRGPRARPGEENYQWFEIEDPADFLFGRQQRSNIKRVEDLHREFEAVKPTLPVIAERFGDHYYVLSHIDEARALVRKPGQDDWSLKNAYADRDEFGKPCMAFTLDERGGSKFDRLTRGNLNWQLAIFLDDQAISHATIQSAIRTHGRITGSFTMPEVNNMVRKLEAGSLPRKLKEPPISVRSIGPSLGEANRAAGLRAAQYGAVLVVAFMLVYYYYAGTIAVIAVALNTLMVAAALASLGATLTLPGIAGLVLSVGMAVDANVLINERIREELNRGVAIRMAIRLGYERAFSAILDSNVTTVLTCAILYFLGSEEIKGFGLTLGIGVVVNLLTAYFVTRFFFEFMSMLKLPAEVTRYPLVAAGAIAGIGAAFYGLGYLVNDELARQQSVLMMFGRSIMYCGPGVAGVYLLMWIGRLIHSSFQSGGKQRLPMMRLIGVPSINWTGLRTVFYTISITAVIGGGALFFSMDRDDLFDIEFLGGTEAQVDLKHAGSLDAAAIRQRLADAGAKLRALGDAVAQSATVSEASGEWTLKTPGVPAARIEPVVRSVLDEYLNELSPIEASDPAAESVIVRTKSDPPTTLSDWRDRWTPELARYFRRAGEALAAAQVQPVQTFDENVESKESFAIVTRETNKEVVVAAILDAVGDDIRIQPALTFKFVHGEGGTGPAYIPIVSEKTAELGLPIPAEEAAGLDMYGWKGGVAMVLDDLDPPQDVRTLNERLKAMRLQPGFEQYGWREAECIPLHAATPGGEAYDRVLVRVIDQNYPLDENDEPSSTWVSELAEPEVKLVEEALRRQTSLSQITQFDEQVSGEAKTDAYIALTLSWLGIVIYLWFRFGNFRWGAAAVVALIHDLIIVCGAIAVCHYLSGTAIGRALLLDKFRIDLAMVAALLTVVGYSVNDTIVVFDRIRENRGRMSEATAPMISLAINQTLSRTLLTGLTTLFTILTMYVFGGEGIHGFNFAMLVGILTGTYSSFAIAGQMLLRRSARAAA